MILEGRFDSRWDAVREAGSRLKLLTAHPARNTGFLLLKYGELDGKHDTV